jgi:hypothetical protein
MRITAKTRKFLGLMALVVPLGILALFTAGEVAGGDVSGLQHVVQALPLVALALLAWRKPRAGGVILIIVAIALAVLYAFNAPAVVPGSTRIVFGAVLFGPAIVSGALFISAHED